MTALTKLSAEELATLQRLAEGATPGPWSVGHTTGSARDYSLRTPVHVGVGGSRGNALALVYLGGCGATSGRVDDVEANAAYIAAANPATLLRLLAQVREAEWQPIATLPVEGGPFLVYWPLTIVGHAEIDLCSYEEYSQIVGFGESPATHWQPLPPPPAREGSEG